MPTDGPSFVVRTFSDGRRSRRYWLFLPTRLASRMPLVVMLHGAGQTAEDFASGTMMNEVAEEHGVIVVYPEQPWSANVSRSWNWYLEADQKRNEGEPALIAGITRRVIADFPVDDARVYVAGLSSGGAAAAVMALAYPDLFAAACIHSGLASGAATGLVSAFKAMRVGGRSRTVASPRAVPTIVFHGDRDAIVNHANAAQVVIQMTGDRTLALVADKGRSDGGVGYTRNVSSDGGGAQVEEWILHGGGHAWSGGSAAGSHTAPLGPDATREAMRFFLEHRMVKAPVKAVGTARPRARGAATRMDFA